MVNEPPGFYGRILIVLFVTVFVGLYTAEPSTTGYVVKETEQNFFDVRTFDGDTRACADGSLYGECSTLIKPKFCVYGTLVDYCELCGCEAGEVCQNRQCVRVE